MRRSCVAVLLAVAVLFGVPAQAAAKRAITFTVDPVAEATVDGTSLTVQVTVGCPPNYEVLEAFGYVVQDGVESDPVYFPLTCRHKGRDYTLTVRAPEGQTWADGPAYLSGYVLLERKSDLLSVSPVARLEIVIP
jgi:hypothetical protein